MYDKFDVATTGDLAVASRVGAPMGDAHLFLHGRRLGENDPCPAQAGLI